MARDRSDRSERSERGANSTGHGLGSDEESWPPADLVSLRLADVDVIRSAKVVRELGSGTFGVVRLYSTRDGPLVIKESRRSIRPGQVDPGPSASIGYPNDFLLEVDTLEKLSKVPGVIGYRGALVSRTRPVGYLCLEPCLENLKTWSRRVDFRTRVQGLPALIRDMGRVLALMHHLGLVHGDIKSNNILVTSDLSYRLADFGKTRAPASVSEAYTGISMHKPPKRRTVWQEELYAFGVVLVEVLLGDGLIPRRGNTSSDMARFYSSQPTSDGFDVAVVLQQRLSRAEYDEIPSLFWRYVTPAIRGTVASADQLQPLNGPWIRLTANILRDHSEPDTVGSLKMIRTLIQNHADPCSLSRDRLNQLAEYYARALSRLSNRRRSQDKGEQLSMALVLSLLGRRYRPVGREASRILAWQLDLLQELHGQYRFLSPELLT